MLVREVLQNLNLTPQGVYLDATLGEGGHALQLLDATSPDGRVLGLDRDPRSLDQAIRRLSPYGQRFTGVKANYTEMVDICRAHGIEQADGVLMDLGFSSRQIEEPGYGFSFQGDEPLDMRYDPEQDLTAEEIVNSYPQDELAGIIYRYGEERRSRAIARAIVRNRPVNTTQQLAQVVAANMGPVRRSGRPGIHPATRTFQALRIAVNGELDHLETGLDEAIKILATQARLVVISYHSLEDRIVKSALGREAAECICPPGLPQCVCGHQPRIKNVNRRVIKPSSQETEDNPRSRSARMRVAQRL
ncbi:MAG: 16S rRNA (cytosine(1402)-N(4))-methyltransferase [SAR202 cluster bacterium Io17-Chloro-G9]|nr:MAG: 16S rRNA (cytosine(1402)-N(4))-methyltransferase [SAR202 cluster bacterium Io17-Chloro-G9]